MKQFNVLSSFLLLIATFLQSAMGTEERQVFELYHSVFDDIPDTQWTQRGSLELNFDGVKKKVSLKFLTNVYEFTGEEVAAFKRLVSTNGFYRVRIRNAESDGPWMMASLPACVLNGNKFRDTFHMFIDKSGDIIGFNYQAVSQNSNCDIASIGNEIKVLSKSKVSIPAASQHLPESVPIKTMVGTSSLTPGKENPSTKTSDVGSDDDDDSEENKPEPGFFRKYWYLLVPVALLSFLAPAPEAGGEQSGASQKKKK